jgi:hypothetical protein
MAEAGPGLSVSLTAAEDITSAFLCVQLDSDGVRVSTSPAGESVCGIVQSTALAGQVVEVQFSGVSKIQAGGLYSAGELLCSDNTGHLVALRSSYALYPLNIVVAVALTAATDLDVITFGLLYAHPQPGYLSQSGPSADWWQAGHENDATPAMSFRVPPPPPKGVVTNR